jgi:NagD protein
MTKAPMILTGKPSAHALRFVAKRLRVPIRSVGVVGDDPAVEIIMAHRAGAMAFGVTTGVMTADDWERETGKRRPHRVLAQLRDLLTGGVIQGATHMAATSTQASASRGGAPGA